MFLINFSIHICSDSVESRGKCILLTNQRAVVAFSTNEAPFSGNRLLAAVTGRFPRLATAACFLTSNSDWTNTKVPTPIQIIT